MSGGGKGRAGAPEGNHPPLKRKRKGRSEAEGCTSGHLWPSAEAWGYRRGAAEARLKGSLARARGEAP
jgi:hypothetical protein